MYRKLASYIPKLGTRPNEYQCQVVLRHSQQGTKSGRRICIITRLQYAQVKGQDERQGIQVGTGVMDLASALRMPSPGWINVAPEKSFHGNSQNQNNGSSQSHYTSIFFVTVKKNREIVNNILKFLNLRVQNINKRFSKIRDCVVEYVANRSTFKFLI